MNAFLPTRGFLGISGQLFINGLSLSSLAGDLYVAVSRVLLADTDLIASFGREGFLWIDLAPPGESLPVAVLSHVSAVTLDEPAEAAGSRTRVESRTFQVTVYDPSREQAASLATALAEVIEAASEAGTLTHDLGTTIDASRDGIEVDTLEDEAAAGGSDVWGRMIQFSAMVVRS